MVQIQNDADFKEALLGLDPVDARVIGAKFVESVTPLADDQRLRRIVDVALTPDAMQDELAASLRTARSIMVDTYTRCGADGDWNEQAGYFVARAAVACLSPIEKGKPGGPAWQAAMSSRMARTSASIVSADEVESESGRQYSILSEFLNARERELS
ncbi:MAG: hypothetical protein P8Z31_06560 [Gammaproteobacteria bacterium]|jgi:hypothetical protein